MQSAAFDDAGFRVDFSGRDDGFGGDEGDELDLGVGRGGAGGGEGAVCVVGKGSGVGGVHFGFGDEVQGFGDGEHCDW